MNTQVDLMQMFLPGLTCFVLAACGVPVWTAAAISFLAGMIYFLMMEKR